MPRTPTQVNANIEFQLLDFILIFLRGRNDYEWICYVDMFILINDMRSCNERTTLHCVESYLNYIILVMKKLFSEEWNEGENNRIL